MLAHTLLCKKYILKVYIDMPSVDMKKKEIILYRKPR